MIPIEVENRIALFLFSTIPSRRYRFKSILVTPTLLLRGRKAAFG